MKMKLILALFVMAGALHAADDKDLPPGLRKKDKLPPGIAKKRGGGEAERVVTNTVTVTNLVTQTVPNNVPAAAAKPAAPVAKRALKVDLDKHVHAINTLDNREAVRRAGLAAIANETGVSVATLQKQHREHETIGTAGLLMGNAIAAKTRRPVGNYFRQHAEGKPWERIAADNQVNLEELETKLSRVETAMRAAK